MDFLKKKSSAADDGIIELTDIIQEGKETTAVKNSPNQAIETQMDNLFSGGNKESGPIVPDDMDADIDAMLAEMQDSTLMAAPPASTATASTPQDSTSPPQVSMNPDEELEMPNMAEVDALLEGLDIPPQPSAEISSENATADSDELDDLLNGLMDGQDKSPKSAPKPAVNAAAPPTMNLDDLDDLLAADDIPTPAPAAAPKVKAAEAPSDEKQASFGEDLDALLGFSTPTPAPEANVKASPEAAAPPESPAAKTPAPAPAELSLEDDLDALLAAVAPPAPTAPAASPAPPKAAPQTAVLENPVKVQADVSTSLLTLEDDLDAILGADAASATATPPLEAERSHDDTTHDNDDEAVDMSDLGAEVTEDFLADIFDTPASDKATLDNDLLAGLNVVDGLDGLPQHEKDVEIFTALEALQKPAPAQEDPLTMLDAQDIAMLSSVDVSDMPQISMDSPKDEADMPELDELDKLLDSPAMQEVPVTVTPVTVMAEAPAVPGDDTLDIALDFDMTEKSTTFYEGHEFTDEDIARAAQELLDEKVREEATTGDVDTSSWLDSLDEVLAETEDTQEPPVADTSAVLCNETLLANGNAVNLDNLLDQLPDSTETGHYIYSPFSPAQQSIPQPTAQVGCDATMQAGLPIPEFDKAYEQGIARLQHITDRFASSLAEADARISALAQSTAPTPAVENIFHEGSPFSATLQTLVRTAVATELRAHSPEPAVPEAQPEALPAPVSKAEYTALLEKMLIVDDNLHTLQDRLIALEDGNKEARLQTVETRLDGQSTNLVMLEERCKALEKNLETQVLSQSEMGKNFQAEVEKAAAAAAARIIREEIAGILAGQ